MKRIFSTLFLACLLGCTGLSEQSPRSVTSLDADWRFHLGEATDAQTPAFNDADWRKLNVPHDWSIEGEYDQANPTNRGGGYLPNGIGWYRKNIVLPASASGKRIFIEFDGVMANSDVWINGLHLGNRPYGYSSFQYELTGKLTFGNNNPNILAVRADNTVQPASRWYTGGGIYRHVRLIIVQPVHIEHWGVYLATSKVSATSATVAAQVSVQNQSEKDETLTVQTVLTSPDGRKFQSAETPLNVSAGKTAVAMQEVEVANPQIWDIESPHLYKAVTTVRSGSAVVDEQTNTVGIREFSFEAATGFWLNGRNIKLYGVCLHHDGGPLGAAVPASVWERRFERLKAIGVNAIRTAHNPMAPEFYDLCDKLGLLVMDESFDTWTAAKPNGEMGYNLHFNEWWEADTRAMVLRDRNHPSIVIYSVGNEIRDPLDAESGRQRFINQRDVLHRLDPTRPVTMALFRPNAMQVYDNGFVELMDVVGQNYREDELIAAWEAKPERKVLGTENGHTLSVWNVLRDKPYMAGQFLWTGINYLGEAVWPNIGSNSGLLDRNGFMKTSGYQRQSWWSKTPMVKITRSGIEGGREVMDWTPADFGALNMARVNVYSNCDEVELFLNGQSLGKQSKNADDSPRTFSVDFEPGVLRAVGYNNGTQAAVDELKSAGDPVKIVLASEKETIRNTWEEVVYVTATVVDGDGIRNPNVNHKLKFTISGPGIILAVDNGNNSSHEPYKATERTVYQGEAVALIQASANSGAITLTVSAPGLEGSTVTVNAVPAK